MGEPWSQEPRWARSARRTHMTPSAWLETFKASWRTALRIDRASLTPFQAVRSMLGVGVPLILGLVTNQVETGVLVASGGMLLGSVGLKDPYQKRTRTMLMSCLFVVLSALVGGIVGGFGWWPVLVAVGFWGLLAGMFASISQTGQVVAIQACSALIVYTHLQLDPFHALLFAGAVGLGTLFQLSLAVVPSPWTNTLPERTALASVYQKLAEAVDSPSEQKTLEAVEALLTGHTTLFSGNTRSERGQMFARLLEEAERLRLTLFVLRRQQRHFAQHAEGSLLQEAGKLLDQLVRQSAPTLQGIALALQSSAPTVLLDTERQRAGLKQLLDELRLLAEGEEHTGALQQSLRYATALLGELRIARRLALSWRSARQYWPVRIRFPYPRPPHLHLENIRANIQANLSPRSQIFRHAVRLSVALMLATVLYQVLGLSVARGYWIPMTTALVLRSDFITTFTRGTARLLGTVLGAVLTTLLVVLLNPPPELLAALMILASYVMFATLFANYALFSAGTTMAVAFLLSFTHAPTVTTAADRALDTTIGGLLALLIYALWPTWEQSQVPENIAKRLEMLGRYFYELMRAYADPAHSSKEKRDRLRRESRLARSNAFGSLQRSLQEPAAHRVDADLAQGILAAVDNLARCVLDLEAYLYDNPQLSPCPQVLAFAATVESTLDHLASAVRTRQPVEHLPDIQAALQPLKNAAKRTRRNLAASHSQWHFIMDEAKRITTYLQTMQQLLSTSSFASPPKSLSFV